jgi:hypothetical protein
MNIDIDRFRILGYALVMVRRFLTSRRATIALAGAAILVAGGFVVLQVHAKPFVRNGVESPIYTVGDSHYADALNDERRVSKLGPIPLGLYRGGRAFGTTEEARQYIREAGHEEDGWGVYELSGDFDLDTREIDGRYYIARTLLVVRRVDGEW